MQLGRVLGSATASIKHPSLAGYKLLLVQPYQVDGTTPDGDPLLAVDGVGAGRGETVIITSDGKGARELLGTEATPARWTVIGIQDA
jgi:ethanolamine utilization protein EutN